MTGLEIGITEEEEEEEGEDEEGEDEDEEGSEVERKSEAQSTRSKSGIAIWNSRVPPWRAMRRMMEAIHKMDGRVTAQVGGKGDGGDTKKDEEDFLWSQHRARRGCGCC